MDELPSFLRFAPVPVRARHDGWTPERQRRFVLAIARGAGPGEAARSVGLSRQTAHALRRRKGAEEFARAWDEAAAFADRAGDAGRALARTPGGGLGASPGGGLDRLWVPRFHRGRLIGYVVREDDRGLLRTLAALDRLDDRVSRRAAAAETGAEGGAKAGAEGGAKAASGSCLS